LISRKLCLFIVQRLCVHLSSDRMVILVMGKTLTFYCLLCNDAYKAILPIGQQFYEVVTMGDLFMLNILVA
jgi:hypothetical protein